MFNLWWEIDQKWWKKNSKPYHRIWLFKIFEKRYICWTRKKSKSLGNLKLKPIKALDKFKLPSNRQLLERMFALENDHASNIQKKKKIAEKLFIEIDEQYDKIPCLTQTKTKYINNILKLHKEWKYLQRNILHYLGQFPCGCLDTHWNLSIGARHLFLEELLLQRNPISVKKYKILRILSESFICSLVCFKLGIGPLKALEPPLIMIKTNCLQLLKIY